jgi:RimJ/RimL family protein N-acetyltransferase
MAWQLTDDLNAFDASASAFIEAKPTQNTMLLSVCHVLRVRGPLAFGDGTPQFGWLEDADGGAAAAFVHTPPHPMLLSGLPEGSAGQAAATQLARALSARGLPVPAVNGPLDAAQSFAAAWCMVNRRTPTTRSRHRLYVLGTIAAPSPVPAGNARFAAAADRDLLLRWYAAFAEEVGDQLVNAQRIVDDRLAYGGLSLWEVGGTPVSMAGLTEPLSGGGVRIGPVYTPKERRGHGYAGAVTVAVSRGALERGATEVSLFADVANPTSNALYQRLGFEPVEDRIVLDFDG